MGLYIKTLKAIRLFLVFIVSSLLLDMFVFKAYLKNLLVKANSSSVSPFSTDGQSNYTVLILSIIAIVVISAILHKWFFGRKEAK